ncbi:hypothetical protein D9757_002322 [Collybiopsis confluens]|uniref:F-box domain-containing protein n=1 Tax=Collybiopsis confluens TaxID=2823264 RepID=A0A8H5MFX8_9AGAR|nr:hypothetical protein D9757_002322 [Collybiopsis confluens]
MSTAYRLPPELWLQVFDWATNYPAAYSTTYSPFSSTELQPACPDTAVSLALVCKAWRALVREFLYRDVRIGSSQSVLQEVLREDKASRFVRRATLPFQYTSTPSWPTCLTSVEILKLCNHLEVLVRPQTPPLPGMSQHFQFDADSLALQSLKRLEWSYNVAAEQTGGINSLGATLQNAPNLEYLSIANVPRFPMVDYRQISLPLLSTLSISSLNGHLMHKIAKWHIPSMRHLVLGAIVVSDASYLWETYGSQIHSLELGRHASFLVTDVMSSAIEGCPHLQELNYHLFFTLPPITRASHETIHAVGLHAAQNLMFQQEDEWVLVEKHFSVLVESFSSLRTIRLFGNWTRVLGDSRFAKIYAQLHECGCELLV